MSPERLEILKAIQNGLHTPREIGERLNKKAQTISKLLYLMNKEGLVQRKDYGEYHTDHQTQLSTNNSDNGLTTASIKSMIEEQVEKRTTELTNIFKTKMDKLENENIELHTQLEKLGKNQDKLIKQYEDLMTTVFSDSKPCRNSRGKRLIKEIEEGAKQTRLKKKTIIQISTGQTVSLKYAQQFCTVIELIEKDKKQNRETIRDRLGKKFKGEDIASVRLITTWKKILLSNQ